MTAAPRDWSEDGFCRVATFSPRAAIADPATNARRLLELARLADQQQAAVALFPELFLTSYTCEDLFHTQKLLDDARRATLAILKETAKLNTVIVFGAPLRGPSERLYNCAFVVHHGRILGVIPKTHLPNYGEFHEMRWFASGRDVHERVIDPELGETLLSPLQLFRFGRLLLGVEICEDLWAPNPPSTELGLHGANLILNLSASNEIAGKAEYRRELVRQQSARLICSYAYTSCGPFESTKDIVYSGHKIIAENGVLLAESPQFELEDGILFADVDLEKTAHDRIHNPTFMGQRPATELNRISEYPETRFPLHELKRDFSRHPFLPHGGALDRRSEEIFVIQATGLARRFVAAQATRLVIGESGGRDSALALLVCAEALDRLKLPRERLLACSLPGPGTSDVTRDLAKALARDLGASFREIDMSASFRQQLRDLRHPESAHDITYENAQARIRTLILMDLANQEGGFVVGTSDLTELALGWCTYNGDHMSGYAVNASVPKTLIQHLLRWYQQRKAAPSLAKTLDRCLAAPSSPELLPPSATGAISQETEKVLGPLELHDFFLFHLIRNGFSPNKILSLATRSFRQAYSEETIRETLRVFLHRFASNQFKRSCLPCGPKVGSVSLSPRGDWRMPDEASFRSWLEDLKRAAA